MNFCFLEVICVKWDSSNHWLLGAVRKSFNSKPTTTPVNYPLNHSVLFINCRQSPSVWIVLETRHLRDAFRCPLLGAAEELFSFCLPSAQGQACSGGTLTCLEQKLQNSITLPECTIPGSEPRPGEPPTQKEPGGSAGNSAPLDHPWPPCSVAGWLLSQAAAARR